MPPVSEAQRKWAYANKDKRTKEGAAAREYIKHDDGRKLPERKKPPIYDHPRSPKKED